MKHAVAAFLFAAALAPAAQAGAAEPQQPTITLTLKDHRFTPETLTLPAGVRVRIDLTNLDASTEEFDSTDLKVEKLVTPKARISFFVGPLKPGPYSFVGEFHPATAQGHVLASAGR